MNYVITATWYDSINEPFRVEFYDGSMDELKILDYYTEGKRLCNKEVIANYPDTRVYSDGTRVRLTLSHIRKNLGETTQTIEAGEIDERIAPDQPRLPGFP